jgi:D-alanyl-lipoteichoic acid acyltransferase DltB (MBOAT superfamily)
MLFTSFTYVVFFIIFFSAYWLCKSKWHQNALLLIGSYIFYGFVDPRLCLLLAGVTLINFLCGNAMTALPNRKRVFLIVGLILNLVILCFFKYFNFFAENLALLMEHFGLSIPSYQLEIILPVGISFYIFQALSYTIDVYWGKLAPKKQLLDFALFISFFPQLVAGPIERAHSLLPQIETKRTWDNDLFLSAWPLLITGYCKKIIIADNLAVYVDKVFMLQHPSLFLLALGSIGFAFQIYADFSAYTDIARGSARLLGFRLIENFNSPYLAISPSDFWRRWHISFSTWIRDYLYIPLGGSRVQSHLHYFLVIMTTMGLSGLWHGAAWTYVVWGLFHGFLLFVYRVVGLGGRWKPQTQWAWIGCWSIMITLTCISWTIFRAPSLTWLLAIFQHHVELGMQGKPLVTALVIGCYVLLYSSPLALFAISDRFLRGNNSLKAFLYGFALSAMTVFSRSETQDFIYFQF